MVCSILGSTPISFPSLFLIHPPSPTDWLLGKWIGMFLVVCCQLAFGCTIISPLTFTYHNHFNAWGYNTLAQCLGPTCTEIQGTQWYFSVPHLIFHTLNTLSYGICSYAATADHSTKWMHNAYFTNGQKQCHQFSCNVQIIHFIQIYPSFLPSYYGWQTALSSLRRRHMEGPATWRHIYTIACSLQQILKTFLLCCSYSDLPIWLTILLLT